MSYNDAREDSNQQELKDRRGGMNEVKALAALTGVVLVTGGIWMGTALGDDSQSDALFREADSRLPVQVNSEAQLQPSQQRHYRPGAIDGTRAEMAERLRSRSGRLGSNGPCGRDGRGPSGPGRGQQGQGEGPGSGEERGQVPSPAPGEPAPAPSPDPQDGQGSGRPDLRQVVPPQDPPAYSVGARSGT